MNLRRKVRSWQVSIGSKTLIWVQVTDLLLSRDCPDDQGVEAVSGENRHDQAGSEEQTCQLNHDFLRASLCSGCILSTCSLVHTEESVSKLSYSRLV